LYILFVVLSLLDLHSASAQIRIVPDNTLGSENATVTNAGNVIQIGGGANRGITNLGSYLDFNINNGQSVNINTLAGIRNIVIRVTGSNISEILGNLSVSGQNKNLFFMNPNGTVFGQNARILINGGVTATTARSLDFNNEYSFLASTPNNAPPFALGNPTSLSFSGFTGAISVQGSGHSITQPNNVFSPNIGAGQSLTGIRLAPGNTLNLAAGEINLQGGLLTASNINLNSIISGKLLLYSTSVDTTNISTFGNVNLSNKALLDSSGFGGGNISIFGKDIAFTDGSLAIISNFGTLPAGQISFNASGTIDLNGIGALSQTPPGLPVVSRGIISQTFNGKGADIKISAQKLVADNSVGVVASTFGPATGGNLSLDVKDVQILGTSPFGPSSVGSLILSTTAGTGQAGTIFASGDNLFIDKGGFLISATFGPGPGGDVNANFKKITLNGGIPIFDQNTFVPSAIASTSAAGGAGGTLNIRVNDLRIDNGARVDASALSNGKSGGVNIFSNNIDLNGTAPGILATQNPSYIISSASQVGPFLISVFNLSPLTAQSGTVNINSKNITVKNGAQITSKNDGTGIGGEIFINSQNLILDSNGSINSSTNAGSGGSIDINTSLLFTRNSQILASAGKNGTGGNISINSDVLAGDYLSAIRANAQQGSGGNIKIDTNTLIFPLANITATSDRGIAFDGNIQIDAKDFGPQQRKQVKPQEIDKESTIACNPASNKVSFVITAGDVPDDVENLRELDTPIKQAPYFIDNKTGKKVPIVEMQGWIDRGDGTAIPIAYNESAFGGSYLSAACKELAKSNVKTQ
jgi:filamentous hemagglutinin family protein